MRRLTVGVAIPTIGRSSLAVTLNALRGQEYDQLLIIRDRVGNLCNARNRAAGLDVDVIAYTDDDTVPDPGFVEAGRRYFQEHPQVVLMQGRTYGHFSASETYMFIGANIWVRRSWLRFLPWDEGFTSAGGWEDLAYGWATMDKMDDYGREGVGYCAECAVCHPGPNGSTLLPANKERVARLFPARWERLSREGVYWREPHVFTGQ